MVTGSQLGYTTGVQCSGAPCTESRLTCATSADALVIAWTSARTPKTVCVEDAEPRTQTPTTNARQGVASAGERIPQRTRPAWLDSRPPISLRNDAGTDRGQKRRPPSSYSSRTTTNTSHLLHAPALEDGRGLARQRGLDLTSRADPGAGHAAEPPDRAVVVQARGVRSKPATRTWSYLTR